MTVLLTILIIGPMLNIVSITDLKQNLAKVVRQVNKSGDPVYILQRSRAKAVILDADHYHILERALEDLSDLRDIEASKNEPTVSAESVAKKLGL